MIPPKPSAVVPMITGLFANFEKSFDDADIVLKVLSNYDYFIKKLITYKNQLVSEQRKMELNFKKIIKYEL